MPPDRGELEIAMVEALLVDDERDDADDQARDRDDAEDGGDDRDPHRSARRLAAVVGNVSHRISCCASERRRPRPRRGGML